MKRRSAPRAPRRAFDPAAWVTRLLTAGAPAPESVPSAAIPRGFRFAAAACGVKKKRGSLDLALAAAEGPAATAAVFTTNRLQAAPVRLCREHLRAARGRMRALVVNSGNANCSTGAAGMCAARATAAAAARALGCAPREVFVCSTGVIGVPLPAEKITAALPALAAARGAAPEQFGGVARAILTTDTRPKWAAARVPIGGREVRILGCAKGAGMIHPQMATMLAFVFTDAAISPALLRRAVREIAGRTFNRITVDGDTSTNDTLAVFASGASGAGVARHARGYRRFAAALEQVCQRLALAIVADGEGAQRVVEITVRGAASRADAAAAARAIATSPLVKTALAGADPNWGRILAAAGRSGARFDPAAAAVWMAGTKVYARGRVLPFDERAAHRRLRARYVRLMVDLGAGTKGRNSKSETRRPAAGRAGHRQSKISDSTAAMWTCDFTADYVRINADYRT